MTIDRGHEQASGGYPQIDWDDQPRENTEPAQSAEDFHIPEQQGSRSSTQGDLFEDQDTVARQAVRAFETGTAPTAEKRRMSPLKKGVLAVVGAVAVSAGAGGTLAAMSGDPEKNLPPQTEPAVTGPEVPGPSASAPVETSTTPEKQITPENIEFTVDGKVITGVEGENGLRAKIGTFRENNPELPAPKASEGLEIFKEYMKTLQQTVNMEAEPGGEAIADAATDKILFMDGASGELRDFVKKLRYEKAKIISAEPPKDLFGKPEKVVVAQGRTFLTVKSSKGEITRYEVWFSLWNDSGAIRNNGQTSRVIEKE